MDIMEAIDERISCRAFDSRPIEAEKLAQIEEEVARANQEGGVHFQLYGPREDGFVVSMSESMFAGQPQAYVALAAQEDEIAREKVGYYGERIALLATQLGLGSCWVASTYDKETIRVELAEGEVLHDIMPLGYAMAKTPMKQRTIRVGIRSRNKRLPDLYQGEGSFKNAPDWVKVCIDAVHKGPSAINEQPVVFVQENNESPVRATLPEVKRGLEYTDLGIAKLHFELAAASCGVKGTWGWGVGAEFKIS